MAFIVDEDGNITLVQGDSGQLTINGINEDRNYTAYLAIQDDKRNPIGTEITVQTGGHSFVTFDFIPALTDLLEVKQGELMAEYYYGIKICYKNTEENIDYEDTLLIGNSELGDLNTITVYPKKVEGTVSE